MNKAETMEKTASAVNAAMINLAPSCDPEALERLSADIIKALKTVYDPEIPADIYELGLIYRIDISDDGYVDIDMTLTAPGCPVAGEMPVWVQNAVKRGAGSRRREGAYGVQSALGPKPHVRRGPHLARYVVRSAR